MRTRQSLAAFLVGVFLSWPSQAQTVTMPATVTVAPYRLAAVEMTFDGDDFNYSVAPELDAFREYTNDPKVVRLRVQFIPRVDGPQNGTFPITAVSAKVVDGKGKLSRFQTCLVNVGGSSPVVVITPTPITPLPPGPVVPPVVTPDTKVTAATFVYEKDQHPIPPAVLSALNKLNRERKIVATIFETDTRTGTGNIPTQYKVAHAEAIKAGLPALVVTAGDKVIRVVKDPRDEKTVLEAVP